MNRQPRCLGKALFYIGRCGEAEDLGADGGRERQDQSMALLYNELFWVDLGQDCTEGILQRQLQRPEWEQGKGAPRRAGNLRRPVCLGDFTQQLGVSGSENRGEQQRFEGLL